MFRHILVAIDASAYSKAALPTAIEVANKLGASLFVLHVAEHDRGRAAVFSAESPAEATQLVFDAVKKAHHAGVAAEGKVFDVAAAMWPEPSSRRQQPTTST